MDDNGFQVYYEEAQASWKEFSAAKFTIDSESKWTAEKICMPQDIFDNLDKVFRETLIVLRNRRINTVAAVISDKE